MTAMLCIVSKSDLRVSRGFTLIELMVTVAIIAILAAIAIPSYQQYVMKSRRTAAKTALLDLASREEKYYATNNAYTSLANLGYSNLVGGAVQVPSSSEHYYDITVTLGTSSGSFTASAAPTGAQASDACGTFQITDLGAQTVTGTDSNCW